MSPAASPKRSLALLASLWPFFLALSAFAGSLAYLLGAPSTAGRGAVRVLSYSAFLGSWGPGPELAKRFTAKTGVAVQFLDAGDAGLLLKKLELFPSDVVVGLDGLSLAETRAAGVWRPLDAIRGAIDRSPSWREPEFAAYDWSQMSFVYRKGELEPPRSLQELLDPRFRGAIALEDPRTSTPGLQFLLWVLDELGTDAGFEFLEKLKPNIHSVGASWSQAYGAFSKKRAKLAFSYVTSAAYHWLEENDYEYQPAVFATGHPVQVEYAAISAKCSDCTAAEAFVSFLLEPESQKLIMRKNYMFPVDTAAAAGTPFAGLLGAGIKTRAWRGLPALLAEREQLFDRWRRLGL